MNEYNVKGYHKKIYLFYQCCDINSKRCINTILDKYGNHSYSTQLVMFKIINFCLIRLNITN